MASEVAMLVVSCDKFRCWWDIFFQRLERYWPQHGLNLYLLSNAVAYVREDVTNIRTGSDIDWSSNLAIALDHIKEDFVLLMLEDAPLAAEPDGDAFRSHVAEFERREMDYLNLKASPRPSRGPSKTYGRYPEDLLYRASLVPCLWRTSVLRELLLPGETAWQFEIRGSLRSARFPNFFALHRPFFNILHCVVEGRIDRAAYRALRRTGEIAQVDFDRMGLSQAMAITTKTVVSRIADRTLGKYKSKLRRLYFTYIRPRPEWI